MKRVAIIGMGMSPKDLTRTHLDLIQAADVLIGGKRHLGEFKDAPAKKLAITRKLTDLVTVIQKEMKSKKVVVMASGDPLYFGIGPYLVETLGEKNVNLYPNINSVAAAFARIGEAWHDAHVVSLHGRDNYLELVEKLKCKATVAVFTDPLNNPARIAGVLLKKKVSGYEMWVFEQMGTDQEKIKRCKLPGAVRGKYTSPNMVVFKRIAEKKPVAARLVLGTPDNLFAHEKGLITKAEVRTVALAKLQLEKRHVFWDIGAGSGSVALEAGLFVTEGKIFAIEKSTRRIDLIKTNMERFKVANLKTVRAEYPVDNVKLPAPDRIFIGGGGRSLKAVIKAGAAVLKKNGRMVINTVLLANIDTAVRVLKLGGFQTEVVQVQVSKSKTMPWSTRLEAQNPVWVITAYREKTTAC